MHRYWPPLAELVAQLELELGHPCQANAYLTPPGSQGFAVHSDSHDVFVFQTHGIKRWEVHTDGDVDKVEPRARPVDVPADRHPARRPRPGPRVAARDDRDQPAHLAPAARPRPWPSILDGTDDEHLPAGYLDDPAALVDGLADRLAGLADAVRDRRRRPRSWTTTSTASCPVASRAPAADCATCWRCATSTDTTILRRRTGHPCVLVDRGDTLRVLLGDRYLDVPARLRPALEKIRSRDDVSPADLPLDEQSRLVLCRRLIREGLLEVRG